MYIRIQIESIASEDSKMIYKQIEWNTNKLNSESEMVVSDVY